MITLERDATRALGIRAAVSAVIFDRRGRLLLQQRSDGGKSGLPGGSVKIGATLALDYFLVRRLPPTLLGHHRVSATRPHARSRRSFAEGRA